MWPEVLEYLKDASLVARIQETFGVRIHYPKNEKEKERGTEVDVRRDRRDNVHRESTSDSKDRASRRNESKANGHNALEKDLADAVITETECLRKDPELSSPNHQSPEYTITNYFWYYLFLLGTELGDEIFYSSFIPFWFWNIDCAVGRRVVLVWAVVMTVGQILKDVIRWPRPACPPVARLQSKWSQEYGMPSTHAMVAVSIPFGIILFTMDRYVYPLSIGWTIATLWCALVCTSRLYLGMHTVLDILVGVTLAALLMIPLIPLVDTTDRYILSNTWIVTSLIAISIAIIVYYPSSDKWTPTRGDTTMVVSVTVGVHVGAWLNHNTDATSTSVLSQPYDIVWPSSAMLGSMILRTILGFCSVVATKVLCKSFSYAIVCAILNINSKDLERKSCTKSNDKVIVDLVYKYVTCFMIGINTVYFLPIVFAMAGIGRPTFYTEM